MCAITRIKTCNEGHKIRLEIIFRLVTRNYRLICLKSTTPEELYSRKIDHEEYGEALMLAKAYGLDCDLVYQRQWRKTPVSVASIQDYLVFKGNKQEINLSDADLP